jgi:hypothetical protein
MTTNGRPLQAKRLPSSPGSLRNLQTRLWRAVLKAEAILDYSQEHESIELQLKAINSLCQCCLGYLSALKSHDYATYPAGERPYDEHR